MPPAPAAPPAHTHAHTHSHSSPPKTTTKPLKSAAANGLGRERGSAGGAAPAFRPTVVCGRGSDLLRPQLVASTVVVGAKLARCKAELLNVLYMLPEKAMLWGNGRRC